MRERMASVGEFMKKLAESIARMTNFGWLHRPLLRRSL